MPRNEVERRWQEGVPHNPQSIALARDLARIDWERGGDYFQFKFGGDGDNGEHLTYLLDVYFAAREEADDVE